MTDYRDTLERELDLLSPRRIPIEELARRRDRKRRDERIRAGVLGVAITIAVAWLGVGVLRSVSEVPATPDLGIFTDVRGWITFGSSGSFEGETRPDGRWGVWAIDPEDPDEPPVQLSAEDGYPVAWSSDGSKLLIDRSRGTPGHDDYTQSLIVLHADGTETPVVDGVWISGGSFSPDGSEVIFAGHLTQDSYASGEPNGIYVVDADGGGSPELIYEAAKREYDSEGDAAPDIQQTSVFGPQLSPDGTQIAYFEGMGDWGNSLWVMDADGSDRRPIIDDTAGEGLVHAASLGWSPDGARLVFEAAGGISVVGVDGSALTLIAAGGEGTDPQWSPDGSRIAFQRYADVTQEPYSKATLYSMAPDGSDVRSLGHVIHPDTDFGPWSYLGAWNPLAPEVEAVTPAPTDDTMPSQTEEPNDAQLPEAPGAWQRIGLPADPVRCPADTCHVGLVAAGDAGLVATGWTTTESGEEFVGWSSPDGSSWDLIDGDGGSAGLAAAGPGFVAVGGGSIWTSTDGISWELVQSNPDPRDWFQDVSAGGPGIVAVGRPNKAWYSADGLTWEAAEVPPVPADVYPGDDGKSPQVYMTDVAAGADRLVATGWMLFNDNGEGPAMWVSSDGTSWRDVPIDGDVFPRGCDISDVDGDADGFVAVGGCRTGEALVWRSPDGERWERVGGDAFDGDTPRVVTASPLGWVAVGGDAVWTSVDGGSWARVPAEPTFEGTEASDVTTWGSRIVVVGSADDGDNEWVWISGPQR